MRTRFLALVTILAPVIAQRTLRFSLPISSFLFFSFASHRLGTGYGSNFYTWKSSARMCECVHECRKEVECPLQYLGITPRWAYHVHTDADSKENVQYISLMKVYKCGNKNRCVCMCMCISIHTLINRYVIHVYFKAGW